MVTAIVQGNQAKLLTILNPTTEVNVRELKESKTDKILAFGKLTFKLETKYHKIII